MRASRPTGASTSEIACHACRRRKVKCDRELPQCRVCLKAELDCEYPLKAGKPGPKIGSSQRSGLRHRRINATKRHEQAQQQQQQQSNLQAFDSPDVIQVDDNDSDGDEPPGIARRDSKVNINKLSFILHPCHEASTPNNVPEDKSSAGEPHNPPLSLSLQRAYLALELGHDTINEMIQIYFRNMNAVSLFHQSTFAAKLAAISSPTQICALLAAMIGFAAKFYKGDSLDGSASRADQPAAFAPESPKLEIFQAKAFKFINDALAECDDETPPICVVQALVISTLCQLTRGVHGKAWRSLGMCVRLAYELNLHLIDAGRSIGDGQQDPRRWAEDEEKRRLWWAIWEMDVFASTIKRTPTAVDWAHMEVFLPINDTSWFLDQPLSSPFLDKDPNQRWKSLQATGNQSFKAWYLVIHSLMKDAQALSSPRGIHLDASHKKNQGSETVHHKGQERLLVADSETKTLELLEILSNAVQCFIMALPEHLRYHGQYLDFDEVSTSYGRTHRELHAEVYNMYILCQLARLMIYQYGLFHRSPGAEKDEMKPNRNDAEGSSPLLLKNFEKSSIQRYFDAANNVLSIINCSHESHIQYIHPFLPSAIWLAFAVQLVRKYFDRSSEANSSLINSRLDVLYMTYKRCVDFWDIKTAMQQNLEALQVQLENQIDSEPASSREPKMAAAQSRERQSATNLSHFPNGTNANSDEAEKGPLPGGFGHRSRVATGEIGRLDRARGGSEGQVTETVASSSQWSRGDRADAMLAHSQAMLPPKDQCLGEPIPQDDDQLLHQHQENSFDQVQICPQFSGHEVVPTSEQSTSAFQIDSIDTETLDSSSFGAGTRLDGAWLDFPSPQLPTFIQELLSGAPGFYY